MAPDAPEVQAFLRRSMNVRVATLSAKGIPHLTALRFVIAGARLYVMTGAAAPVARHIAARPDVVLLFDAEQRGPGGCALRIAARAVALPGDDPRRNAYTRRAARKYFLRPGALWNMLRNRRALPMWRLGAQNREGALAALIEFTPQRAEFVARP